MMDGPGDAAQPEQPDAPAPDTPAAAEEAPKPGMQPLFEPKIPEEYADLTVDQETQPESQEPEKKRPRLPSGIRVLLYVCCVADERGRRGHRLHPRRRDDLADRRRAQKQGPRAL